MKHPLILLTFALLPHHPVFGADAAPPKPNILVILTDDIGWGDYGCYNAYSKVPTPHIDRLAREGMRFTNAHTPAGLCAPTRYSMLTGNYPWRSRAARGVWGFNVPSALKPGQKTVANLIHGAGYRTAMFGKAGIGGFWANAAGERPTRQLAPIQWGFDYSFLIPRGHQIWPQAFYENGVAVSKVVNRKAVDWDTSKVGERLLAKANAFLDDIDARQKKTGSAQPFYIHFCTDGAHAPYEPAETLAGEPLKGVTKMTAHTDMVHETDILTGALVAALEKRGLLTNTLIFVTSDNGGLPHERWYGHDAVAGLRGEKAFIFDGGNRVPFIAWWPGHIPAGTVRRQVICAHDTVATALELAGVNVPQDQARDSASLVPVLVGQRDDSQPVRDHLLVQSSPGRDAFDDGGFRAVRPGSLKAKEGEQVPSQPFGPKPRGRGIADAVYRGNWKLVYNAAGKPAALYNLANDLAEEKNLISDPSETARISEMSSLYERVRKSDRSVPTPPKSEAVP